MSGGVVLVIRTMAVLIRHGHFPAGGVVDRLAAGIVTRIGRRIVGIDGRDEAIQGVVLIQSRTARPVHGANLVGYFVVSVLLGGAVREARAHQQAALVVLIRRAAAQRIDVGCFLAGGVIFVSGHVAERIA